MASERHRYEPDRKCMGGHGTRHGRKDGKKCRWSVWKKQQQFGIIIKIETPITLKLYLPQWSPAYGWLLRQKGTGPNIKL